MELRTPAMSLRLPKVTNFSIGLRKKELTADKSDVSDTFVHSSKPTNG